jgi:hypothetical protein
MAWTDENEVQANRIARLNISSQLAGLEREYSELSAKQNPTKDDLNRLDAVAQRIYTLTDDDTPATPGFTRH